MTKQTEQAYEEMVAAMEEYAYERTNTCFQVTVQDDTVTFSVDDEEAAYQVVTAMKSDGKYYPANTFQKEVQMDDDGFYNVAMMADEVADTKW